MQFTCPDSTANTPCVSAMRSWLARTGALLPALRRAFGSAPPLVVLDGCVAYRADCAVPGLGAAGACAVMVIATPGEFAGVGYFVLVPAVLMFALCVRAVIKTLRR